MKSKLTITIASILSVLVLVGVGFAAWVIINPSVNKEAKSSITAEGVTDKSYTLDAAFAPDEKIVFGAPAETINGAWLTNPTKADLEAKLTLTLTYNDWAVIPAEFSISMKTKKGGVDDTVFTSLRDGTETTLAGKKIIKDPTISYKDASNENKVVTPVSVKINGEDTDVAKIKKDAFVVNSDEKTATLEITITFGWGEAFGGDNPYTYYNALGYEAKHEEANTVLTALANLNEVKYVVTISGDTKVA